MSGAVVIHTRTAGELVFAAAAIIGLSGLGLLFSGSARRSLLMQRGGLDLQRRRRLDERLDARLLRTRRGADLAGRLRSAGTELTAARFLLLVAGAWLGALTLASLLFPALLAVAAAFLAAWGCFAWLARRLDKRREEFVAQLPEVARLFSNGASAGLSIPASIELAIREIDEPASSELQTVVDELTFGRSLDDALDALQRRLPSRDIAVLMTTLIIQHRAGGDVVRALQELSITLDARRETLREVRTTMAGAVYTAYIVPLLGVFALFMLNTINSKTLDLMTTQPIGIAALLVAAGLYAAGWIAIRRTTRIEV
ncbi:MAG: type II secretion system F family protein [Solirubrobacterales bacterium]|nr:type II secretion system F family protein [Solirubrobacterales bacterium]MBV9472714.1 type II secretion system F family protein [Solirubrobacterales bacterium]